MGGTATGAILHIDDSVLTKIKTAEDNIASLEKRSEEAAKAIQRHWKEIATDGMDAFIQKITAVSSAMSSLGKLTLDESVSKTVSEISALIQALAKLNEEEKRAAKAPKESEHTREAEYARVTTELEKQRAKYIELSAAYEAYLKKKREDTTYSERSQFSQVAAELEALSKSIKKLQELKAAMENIKSTLPSVISPDLDARQSKQELAEMRKFYQEEEKRLKEQQQFYEKLFGEGGTLDKQIAARQKAEEARQKAEIRAANARQKAEEARQKAEIRAANARQKAEIRAANARKEAEIRAANAMGAAMQQIQRSLPQGAINLATNARSLNELKAALSNLKTVMSNIDPKRQQAEWAALNNAYQQTKARIDDITRSMGDFKTQSSQAMNIAGQLKNSLALLFSVSAIRGYIDNLVKVRAQFELQQTALRAILQDKQEADKIFAQVQQMALQSPFSIMEMNTFVKQLAAYRIETDKLVGTTKMLADVSAGLGVDMQRLILAYGQVKAANYLRACLGAGTPVMLYDGTFKNVEDVVIGDVLMGDDEEPRHVSKLYQGEQMMYRVNYNGGMFRCNEHHILTVYDALTELVTDVFVFDYINEPHRYQGVKRINGRYVTFPMKVERDIVDTYYGFTIDGNRRFIIQDNIVTHNTEVRQFTEAGLNIAGELATYFSELEGRMVSVGEVMEMITKRMVRFEDVEEIFKRVTSAGGLFYDMQKKQSDTLHGQMQRIKDAMSIMFNEIGKSNQGLISGVLTTIRNLISNWQTFADILKVSVAGLGAYKVAVVLARIATSDFGMTLMASQGKLGSWLFSLVDFSKKATLAGKAVQVLRNSLIGLSTVALPMAIVAGAAILIERFISARNEANKLKNTLNEIATESARDSQKGIENYKRLARMVADITTSYEERNAALDELKRTYGDILPKQDLEREGIEAMAGNYDKATEALRTYYAAKRQELQIDATEKSISENVSKLVKDRMFVFEDVFPAATFDKIAELYRDTIVEGVKNGQTDASELFESFLGKLQKYYGTNLPDFASNRLKGQLANMFDTEWGGVDYKSIIRDQKTLNSLVATGAAIFETSTQAEKNELFDLQKRYDEHVAQLNELKNAYMALYQLKKRGNLYEADGVTLTRTGQDAVKALNDIQRALGLANISTSELNVTLASQEAVLSHLGEVSSTVYKGLNTEISSASDTAKRFKEMLDIESLKAQGTDLQKAYRSALDYVIQTYGISADWFDKIRVESDTTRANLVKDLKAQKAALEETVKVYDQIAKSIVFVDATAEAFRQTGWTADMRKEAEETIKALDTLWKAFGGSEKEPHGGGRGKDVWAERLSLMQKVNKEYEKLLKYYTKEDAMAKIRASFGDAVAETFANTKWSDIGAWGEFDSKATIERLRDLASSAGKETRKKILEAVGVLEAELDIKIKEKEIEDAKKAVAEMFDNLELSKTLTKLGLQIDFTYLVGGKPMTLDEIKQNIINLRKAAESTKGQEGLVKFYKEQEKKIDELENKAQSERLKNYSKYIRKMYDGAAKVQLDYYGNLKAMMDDFERYRSDLESQLSTATGDEAVRITNLLNNLPSTAKRAAEGMRKEMEQELAKINMDNLLKSPLFAEMFQDLGSLTNNVLDRMIEKIEDIQKGANNLSLSQVRQLAQYAEKLQQAKIDNSPFKESIKAIKEAYDLRRKGITAKSASESLAVSEAELARLEQLKVDLETVIGYKEQGAVLDGEELVVGSERIALSKAQVRYFKQSYDMNKMVLALRKEDVSTQKGVVAAAAKLVQTYKNAQYAQQRLAQALQQASKAAIAGIEAMTAGIEAFGGEISDSDKAWLDFVGQMMQTGLELSMMFIALGITITEATGIIGIIAAALTVVAGLFKTILGAHDSKLQDQIEDIEHRVDSLTRAFDKLKDSIDNAFTSAALWQDSQRAIQNLEAQKNAYYEMIRLEEAKKQTDDDKVREYLNIIDDINDKIKETRASITEAWGGFGSQASQASAAESIASAWLQSFRETGDGLDALNEQWDEYIDNLLVKQMYLRVVSARMKKLFDMVDAAVSEESEGGYHLTREELDAIKREKERINSELNDELKDFMAELGEFGGGEYLLSDLQKGIQNITEPQAAALESYMNSIRFEVFKHTELLQGLLNSIRAQYTENASPMLEHVRVIREMVTDIRDSLRSVIVRRGQSSQYVLKVD